MEKGKGKESENAEVEKAGETGQEAQGTVDGLPAEFQPEAFRAIRKQVTEAIAQIQKEKEMMWEEKEKERRGKEKEKKKELEDVEEEGGARESQR